MSFFYLIFFYLNLIYWNILIKANNIIFNKHINNTQKINVFDQNHILIPIDAADLLECSKNNEYILIDKTNNIPSYNLQNQLYPLESIYLSNQFFGIIESIAGTTGNFINDAITGIQIPQVINTLKNTYIEIYLGTINDHINKINKISNINLSCIYDNLYPTFTNFDQNNFCEYTHGLNKNYILLSQDHICSFKNIEKYDFKNKIKYFNIMATLSIPILHYKEFNKNIFSSIDSYYFLNNSQMNINKYILLSNELGLSFFINFGIGLFGKKNYEKYYILIKMIPPDYFWSKDHFNFIKEQDNNKFIIKKNIKNNLLECSKFEKRNDFINNSIFFIQKDENEAEFILENNSVNYLNIKPKNIYKCLNKYKIIFYSNSSEPFSIIKIFEIDDFFKDIKYYKTKFKENNYKYIYEYNLNKILFNIQIIIVNKFKGKISYKIICNYKNILLNKLFLNTYESINENNSNIFLRNTKKLLINYSNKIIYILLILLLIIILIILIKILIRYRKVFILKNENLKFNKMKLPLIKDNDLKRNDINNIKFSRYCFQNNFISFKDEIEDHTYKIISKFEKHDPSSSLSSISPVTFLSIPNTQIFSPNQIDVYTAISSNITDNFQNNTDYSSSSPSTIKSITFKH